MMIKCDSLPCEGCGEICETGWCEYCDYLIDHQEDDEPWDITDYPIEPF